MLTPKQEIVLAAIGTAIIAATVLLFFRNDEAFGPNPVFPLVCSAITGALFWLRFRKRAEPPPAWLKRSSNLLLALLTPVCAYLLLDWAAWYK